MTRELTAFEVLRIAEQMEQNAARFYRKAAGIYQEEKKHVRILRQSL